MKANEALVLTISKQAEYKKYRFEKDLKKIYNAVSWAASRYERSLDVGSYLPDHDYGRQLIKDALIKEGYSISQTSQSLHGFSISW